MENKVIIDYSAGESRNSTEAVNYMLGTVEIDGKDVELYAEMACDINDLDDEVVEANAYCLTPELWDEVHFPALKDEIISQAAKYGISAEEIEFFEK